jgi:hypothetical protein
MEEVDKIIIQSLNSIGWYFFQKKLQKMKNILFFDSYLLNIFDSAILFKVRLFQMSKVSSNSIRIYSLNQLQLC